MVEKLQTDNPLNNPMHYGEHQIGVLNPPDKLPGVELYSYQKTLQNYSQLQSDIYQKRKKSDPLNKRKFPTGLTIVGAVLLTGVIFRKNISKLFKRFFK